MAGGHSVLAVAFVAAVGLAGCSGSPPLNGAGALGSGVGSSTLTTTAPSSSFDPFGLDNADSGYKRRVVISNPSISQIMKPGPLPEMTLGRADAPVTIIKYASMTCPYCRLFQIKTFPVLKREYIDTGKVRFILREFPIGFQSGAATIALRCAPPKKYFDLYDKLMRQQRSWVSQDVRRDPIFKVAQQVGLSRSRFDACFADKALAAKLKAVKDRGRELGIIGTPNFFVNGELIKRRLTITDIHSLVSKALAKPVAAAN
ncbi:MAG: DsbA family protein [Hyphomicrobiaceae bacterium]